MAGDTSEGAGHLLSPTALPRRHQAGLLGLLALAVAPLLVSDIDTLKLTSALFLAVYAMSWDAVSGYTGQISFGHALFFAAGGYTTAILNVHYGVSPVVGIPLGVLVAALAGLAIGVPALRVRGPYLSLITLVAPLIVLQLFVYFSGFTGGEIGLLGVEQFTPDPTANYYIAFGVFLFALAVFLAVTRSDAGSVFTAIREDEDAVVAAGLNPAKFKIFAFVLSAAVGGFAGAVFAHTVAAGALTPSQILALTVSIEVIIAPILGGMGTITGAAVGGLFFWLLRDQLRQMETVIPLLDVAVKQVDLLVFLLITLGFLFFLPEGIVPRLLREARRLGSQPSEATTTDGGRSPLEASLDGFRDQFERLRGGDRK